MPSKQLLFEIGTVGQKHPRSYQYYGVHGTVKVARLKTGFRYLIYQDAVDAHACHDFRIKDASSIYYPEGDDTLHFSLLFKTEGDAHTFQNKLLSHANHPFKRMTIDFNKEHEVLDSEEVAKFMFIDDYKKRDSDSPENSLRDTASASELPNIDDPMRSLRSLENLSLLPRKDVVYKCHIAPKAFYKGKCSNDINNILFESHLFHIYFDGDGKRRPKGSNLDWGRPPELWLEYDGHTKNASVLSGISYDEVFVLIIFRDSEVADSMKFMWKFGTENVADNKFRSSFFTTNVASVQQYLQFKKHETRIRWGVREDMVTPQDPAVDEVESQELEASGIVEVE